MDKNQRKNRPKKKEMTEETWSSQFNNLREIYGFTEQKDHK